MLRYLALLWDAQQGLQERGDALTALLCGQNNWTCVIRSEGLVVLASGAGVRVLPQNRGVVLGVVFARSDCARGPSIITPEAGDEILVTAGRSLMTRYWGRYVAILRDSDGARTRVLRDPCGGLPCFVTSLDDLTIVFSHLEDVCRLDEFQPSINCEYLSAHALLAPLHTLETALREVSEVQGGECLEINRGRHSRRTYWTATSFVHSEPVEDVQTAVEILGATTRMCVRRWGLCHKSVVLNLSGLDSNIVLRCLTRDNDGPRTTCLNFYSDGPEEDEREVARAGAQAAGCDLIEHRRQAHAVKLERLLELAPSAKPGFSLYALQYAEVEAAIARSARASALFTGYGGDALFLQNGATLAVADYALTHPFGGDLWRIACDASRVDRVSVWRILGTLFRRNYQPFWDIDPERTLVAPQVVELLRDVERFIPASLQGARDLPEGKRRHVLGMSRLPATELPLAVPDAVERIAPLMSQPLIELCLRIPTWVMITGGWDRAIARQAFADELPRRIVRRRGKGGSTDTVRKIFVHQMPFIRELMLEGELVRRGILDRRKVEACFQGEGAGAGRGRMELLVQHVPTEAWLRSWSHQRLRTVSDAKRPSTSAFSRSYPTPEGLL
jgi:asparagine synthase (glutamine-hydrolysing)